jgi:hypothetical protein
MVVTVIEMTELLGNVGEFVGAIAVVATLIYLAHQVRESQLSTRADTLERLQSGFTTVNALPASDSDIARLMHSIFNNQTQDLDEVELYQAMMLFNVWVNQFVKAAQAHRNGIITDNQLTVYANDSYMWFNTDFGKTQTERYRIVVDYLRPYTKSPEEMQNFSPEEWL